MKKNLLLIVLFTLVLSSAHSQEKKKFFSFNGYITTLQNAMFDSLSGPVSYNNILHNRLNIKGYLTQYLTITSELRNRLFTGDIPRSGSYYSELIGNDQGWIDMSWNIINKSSFFLNTTIERMFLDFNYNKFQISIGRQRINWGQTLVWNPNDIFNAYSFFDFDYIERPGSDAVRVQYYPASSSTVELAAKSDKNNNLTVAGLYRFNKCGYDIQFLGGYSGSSDIVAGIGWSGSMGKASLRGETTWFYPVEGEHTGTILATTGIDRVLENNSMFQIQLMYCNTPLNLTDFNSFYSGNLSAKDLAFSEFSAFGNFTWAVNPLLNTGFSAMWLPDLKGYFAGTSLDYSVTENLDCSAIWQHFNCIMAGVRTRINLVFLRIKYSF